MPIKKTAVRKSDSREELMDFDDFVARTPKPKSASKAWLFITLILVIIVLGAAIFFVPKLKMNKTAEYQAIFLDNQQVYFAKVVKEDAMSVYLEDVYYIQTQQQVIPATEEGAEDTVKEVPVLVKRGQELHQPSGWMQINRDKIVSIEQIGAESEILKEIEKVKAQN
ncbi:MAG: hypothetical protein UR94_C0004G0042 [Parcubacteria group bacterium GW2011_GWA2_36_10]|nr:MAG: hypothetical protein UR94_C0004G0042 [Parcubacteria group bacterium GW2011_GWA2_36_10]